MKTEELVQLLAAQAGPVAPHATRRRLAAALALGVPLAWVWMLSGYGLRANLAESMAQPLSWIKLLLPVALAIASVLVLHRLARPGVRVAPGRWLLLAAPVLLLWLLGLTVWLAAPAAARAELLWGQTWRTCAMNIAGIALPVLACVMAALSTLAPLRPALAGAVGGAVAGGCGAAVYSLHCPEVGAPFLAVWYVLGMAIPVALGALLGRQLLRW